MYLVKVTNHSLSEEVANSVWGVRVGVRVRVSRHNTISQSEEIATSVWGLSRYKTDLRVCPLCVSDSGFLLISH